MKINPSASANEKQSNGQKPSSRSMNRPEMTPKRHRADKNPAALTRNNVGKSSGVTRYNEPNRQVAQLSINVAHTTIISFGASVIFARSPVTQKTKATKYRPIKGFFLSNFSNKHHCNSFAGNAKE